MTKQIYFLGGTSPSGFQSKFLEQIKAPGFYTYILKGGPGTGKSTLMKKIADEFKEHPVSLYYCSSDIRSLDAVVIEDKKLIIVDGTAPHVFEALYPGASQEIINLGEFWDGNKLKKHSDAIHYLFDENQKYHARVRCYIEALASLNSDIYTIGEDALNKEKLISYISRFCKKLMIKNKKDEKGKISYKQISAFTTDNYSTQSLIGDYSVYLIKDDLFAGSDFFLRAIADHFVNCGYNITVSECTMHHIPTYEHIISEETGLAFMTSNFFNKIENETAATINFGRFYNKEIISSKKQRLSFNKKGSVELAEEAQKALNTALDIHDELEKNYIKAIDFKRLNKKTEEFISEIKSL